MTDATVMAQAFAKTIAKLADFATELAESIHKDLGIEYIPKKAGKKRTAKAPADPNAPKKPKTAYFLFSDFAREEAKRNGQTPPTVKEIADTWNSLNEEEKAKYAEEAEAAKDAYSKQLGKMKSLIEDEDNDEDDVLPPN